MTEEEAVIRVQPIINHIVNRFCASNPYLDREELLGEAQLQALNAIRLYDDSHASKARLTSWVYTVVHRFFCRSMRSRSWKRRFSKPSGVDVPDVPVGQEWLADLLREVSVEAQTAIMLAIEKQDRLGLLRSLVRELHWEKSLVVQVWREIQEAL